MPKPRIAAGTSQAPGLFQFCWTIFTNFSLLAKMMMKKIATTKLGTETPIVEMNSEK